MSTDSQQRPADQITTAASSESSAEETPRRWGTPGTAVGWFVALKRSLDRPLTSYHLVFGVGGLLLVLGLIMVLSASSVYSYHHMQTGSSYTIFFRQLTWVLVGVPLALLASRISPQTYRVVGLPALLAVLILLGLIFVPGLGVEVNGSRNWLTFGGPFRMQPSEAAKLALVLWGAAVIARKQSLLTQWKHLVIPLIPVWALVLTLVVGGGDLGSSLILFSILLVLLFVVGMPMRFFVFLLAVVTSVVTFLAFTADYRQNRLISFLDPFADYHDSGWQAAHSLFALGTGGWWGVGLGASREKWGSLPEAHTDFIYAVLGEELGLAGTLVVLGLFLTLGYAGIRIAMRSTDTFSRLTAAGIVGWLMAQTVINIGAVVGLLPITGVPLPLVSYGGSSMLPTLVALGILMSLAKHEPGARAALEAKGSDVLTRAYRRVGRVVPFPRR